MNQGPELLGPEAKSTKDQAAFFIRDLSLLRINFKLNGFTNSVVGSLVRTGSEAND